MKITTLRETTMKKMSLKIAAMTLIFGACASNSFAAIVDGMVTSGGGSFMELTAPFGAESSPDNTVGNNNFDENILYAFNEKQNVLLTTDLDVDLLAGGLGSGTLMAGTVVNSYYVFFDPAGTSTTFKQGTVTFSTPILAILTSDDNLFTTNALLGHAGVTYGNVPLQGLEDDDDDVSITSLNTISVNWAASTPGDHVRVLTAAVPEPSTFVLAALSLLSIGCHRRKRA